MTLADTQIVIWLTLDRMKLSRRAEAELSRSREQGVGIGIASTTLWELAMQVSKGRIIPKVPMREYLRTIESMFTVYPITADIAEWSMHFSAAYPKDPADRIIGATALVHGMTLITADDPIRKSGEVPCIW